MQIDGKELTHIKAINLRFKREYLLNYITLTKIQKYEI